MLIFSVSFQFLRMTPEGVPEEDLLGAAAPLVGAGAHAPRTHGRAAPGDRAGTRGPAGVSAGGPALTPTRKMVGLSAAPPMIRVAVGWRRPRTQRPDP